MFTRLTNFLYFLWKEMNPFKKYEIFTLNNPENINWLEDGDVSKEERRLTIKEYIYILRGDNNESI